VSRLSRMFAALMTTLMAALTSLTLTACGTFQLLQMVGANAAAQLGFKKKIKLTKVNNPASEFFQGAHLQMAQAIDAGDMTKLKALAQGQDLTQKGNKDMDLMWFALVRQNVDAIRTLVELGVNPDEQVASGMGSALDTALYVDDTKYLQAMLDGGLSPNHRKLPLELHSPLLIRAATDGSEEGGLARVKLLVERDTRLDDRTKMLGRTALTETVRDRPDIALYLIGEGADFTIGYIPPWDIYKGLEQQPPNEFFHEKWLALRDAMIAGGAKWPPDPPVAVRDQMRARGETVRVPRGRRGEWSKTPEQAPTPRTCYVETMWAQLCGSVPCYGL